MSLLSEDAYVKNTDPCTSFYNIISTYTPNVDHVGPFPDEGYILVIVFTFIRWIELYHTIDATASSAAECLLKRFGPPNHLRSDNGPYLIREFLLLVGVKYYLCRKMQS